MTRIVTQCSALLLIAAVTVAEYTYHNRQITQFVQPAVPRVRPVHRTQTTPFIAATPVTDPAILDAGDNCTVPQTCDPTSIWRSLDGSCNNLEFPMWGQANTALSRLVAAFYNDGVHSVRKSRIGNELPSARLLVTQLMAPVEVPDRVNSLLLMSIGQLISHDSSFINAPSNPSSACCVTGGPACLNIEVPFDDPWYIQYNVTCLPFERAATTASLGCPLRPEYTLATVSHFLDASFLYGSTVERLTQIREGIGGRLRGDTLRGRVYPRSVKKPTKVCAVGSDNDLCVDSGDSRTNQNPPLTALHVLFFREHNRVAEQLALLNPHWNDERIFQETRRVVIAQWQIIVYRDWLPWIIGYENAVAEGLIPADTGMSNDYDASLNPSTTNDFSSAAYRAFHSIVPSTYCRVGGTEKVPGCPIGAQLFGNSFGNPTVLGAEGGLDSVLEGCTTHAMGRMDRLYSKQISGQMFRGGKPWGWDLISIDIQRGRDVGLPGYNTYRSLCGLKPANRWEHLLDTFDGKTIRKLTDLYDHPDDIDLYVGGMLEKKVKNSLVGPTFQCIIVDQFKRWKRGDRFFYDLEGFASSLRADQVQVLRATSMARLLCDNGDKISLVPKDPFVLGTENIHCTLIPSINLMHWREQNHNRNFHSMDEVYTARTQQIPVGTSARMTS